MAKPKGKGKPAMPMMDEGEMMSGMPPKKKKKGMMAEPMMDQPMMPKKKVAKKKAAKKGKK